MGGVLTTRYLDVSVTTAPGTLPGAPLVTPVAVADLRAVALHLVIPAGHTYLTGWALRLSGTVVIPFNLPATWVIGDDDKLDFMLDHEVGADLAVLTYNTGQYAHTHRAILHVTDIPLPVAATPGSTILLPHN